MRKLSILLFSLLFVVSCDTEEHFISDEKQRADVHDDFIKKMNDLPEGDLFSVFSQDLSTKQREALEFLYAYMPIGDITDYSGDYYKRNVDAAFMARETMPWGKNVPEREFNHFVLPVRVNNENLDDARFVFYEELKDRVKDMSMYDAVLEVNHWCHEKANYKGSDIRTSSPLATVKTSWGRCGEESTFLVAALRSVCIPARQVYTPRWAHCDDNHAWVEAYVDGNWYFLGACEPEPVLNLGWFNAPSSRCLLLHTRVFGRYFGPEEVIEHTANHTEINVVDNYADTGKLTVKVLSHDGKPLQNVPVNFKIYNYAEFNTVATKLTDNNGLSWLTAGKGDMMVYAASDGKFDFEVVSIGDADTVTLVLDKQEGSEFLCEFDIVPPVEKARIPEVSQAMRDENDRRFRYEDSIRNAYIATFEEGRKNVYDPDLDDDESLINGIMEKSWGNYQTIKDFLDYATKKDMRGKAVSILSNISDKDLRDVTMDVLVDNLDNTVVVDTPLYEAYILNPRVSDEMIRPYKKILADEFASVAVSFKDNPQNLVAWVRDNIKIRNDLNVRNIPIYPTGVMRALTADSHSRDIFFVAVARSLGIPARIDKVTGKVQYYDNDNWIDVDFDNVATVTNTEKGTLVASYITNGLVDDPRYYTHFTIKKFNGNTFDLLSYDAKDPGMDVGALYSDILKNGLVLDPGYYVLTTGTRLFDGSVLCKMSSFTITSGKKTLIDLEMRKPSENLKVLGKFDADSKVKLLDKESIVTLADLCGKGYYVIGLLDGGSEPTTHAMQDIGVLKEDFEEWGGIMVFVFSDKKYYDSFILKDFKDLPVNVVYAFDENNLFEKAVSNMKLNDKDLPVFMIANADDEVIFVSQGYTIGLGEQLVKTIGMTGK